MESKEKEKQGGSKLRGLIVWALILAALLVWNYYNLRSGQHTRAELPYSTFIEQVNSDNVKNVYIDGDKINGSFIKPVLWPVQPGNTGGTTSEPKGQTQTSESKPKQYSEFTTVFPKEIGDPTLMSLLQKRGVTVEAKSASVNWLITVVLSWAPLILLFIFFIWMGSKVAGGPGSSVLSFGKSRPRRYSESNAAITFEDVAGADEAKAQLKQEVDFLRTPKKYYEIGARIPRGVLLIGPPGTGKTLIAKAVAGEASVPFFSISASEFVEMFVGVGASRVRDLFNQAKASAPSIVFIDELDAVARRRGAGMGTVNDEREQTLNQLLVEMDGFDEREEVIILAATNRPDVLDPALLRPGRFDRHVVMDLPDRKGREGILKIHAKRLKLGPDVDLASIARSSTGMSGADLSNLCNEAALLAARKDSKMVSMSHFEESLDKVLLGEKRQILMDQDERRVIAYHESGHAIVAWFTPDADEVHKVSIIPRGRALGSTEQLPSDDQYNYSRMYLLAKLAVLIGGRTAEEIAIGDVTTGAENDLVEATTLAHRMVTRWGMGNIGLPAFKAFDEHPFLGYELSRGREYSEATAAAIDDEVKRLIEESHINVRKLLSSKHAELDNLAETLLREETIEGVELHRILGPRPKLSMVTYKEAPEIINGAVDKE
jgi:cell division protease FtsH